MPVRDSEARDTSSSKEFFDYYAQQSESPRALERSRLIHEVVIAVYGPRAQDRPLQVLDVGCNAGTQSMIWAEQGHQVFGVDINAPLIDLAKQRAGERGLSINFEVGTAENLPFADASMDVCLAPELLEHVPDWESCVNELARVLRPGGVLFLSTTNCLCPVQDEFALPLYSWYPTPLKHYFERLAVTTRPELVNDATYPAVHWFSFFELERYLGKRGFSCLDRFDTANLKSGGSIKQLAVRTIQVLRPLRWVAHVLTPYTQLIATKKA